MSLEPIHLLLQEWSRKPDRERLLYALACHLHPRTGVLGNSCWDLNLTELIAEKNYLGRFLLPDQNSPE